MADFNQVTLMGTVATEPELRYLPTGTAIANFNLGVKETYKNKQGEYVNNISFIKMAAFSVIAESAGKKLHKGSRILLVGQLKQDRWEGPEGARKEKLYVVIKQWMPVPNWKGHGGGKPKDKTAPFDKKSETQPAVQENDDAPF